MTSYEKISSILIVASLACSLILGFYGPNATIDTSLINKLGHYQKCGTNRSSDPSIPADITDVTCRLIIEITYPTLIYINPPPNPIDDVADIWILFAMCDSPVTDIVDFASRGVLLGQTYLDAPHMRVHCDTPSGLYYTHFYFVWDGLPNLITNEVYCVYLDFYDALGEFHQDSTLWEDLELPPADLIPERPNLIPMFKINDNKINTELTINAIESSYVSFFEYDLTPETQTPTSSYTPTPTPIPTIPTETTGNYFDGLWNDDDNFLQNIQEQFKINPTKSYSILFAILIPLLTIIVLLIVLIIRKKKKN